MSDVNVRVYNESDTMGGMLEKKLIIGNWKMAPVSVREAKSIFVHIKKVAGKLLHVQTVICVPSVYAHEVGRAVTGHRCVSGVQNIHWETEGAFTGEISATQAVSIGAQYAIVGHSERRAAGEVDEDIVKKIKAAVKAGLTPVVCVGEVERDEEGEYVGVLKAQLLASLEGISRKVMDQVVIAYEPVWAIGKKATKKAEPDDVAEIVLYLRKTLIGKYGKALAMRTSILYGGSANADNTESFLRDGGVDGLLVGRASLDPKQFCTMLKIADTLMKNK